MEKIKQLVVGGGAGSMNLPETVLRAFNDLFSRQALNSGVIAAATTTTKLKTTNQITAIINGNLVVLAAQDGATNIVETGATTLPTYVLTATQFGGYVFTVDSAGLLHALTIGPSANLNSPPTFPTIPINHAVFGLALVNTSSANTFTANTTALSAANVQLINVVGPFYPNNAF